MSLLSLISKDVLIDIAGPVPGSKRPLQLEITTQIALSLPKIGAAFGIDTSLRLAHFLSQSSHETDRFSTLREYASGQAYEGRQDLGNVRPGDGRRYPGRGVLQNTGRANYRNLTRWLRSGPVRDAPDFEADPAFLEEFPWALWSAVWFWTVKGLNVAADQDDALTVTRKINGGTNGLQDRLDALARAKSRIARLAAGAMLERPAARNILHRGVEGCPDDVELLQIILRAAGFYHMATDGSFGPATENAVRAFQLAAGLKADGIVGGRTWDALAQWGK